MSRRSRDIPGCLILLAAAAAMGCKERRDCVDETGHKKPDSYCATGAHGGSGGARLIYGGRGGRNVGDVVSGGSTSEGGTVTRGGFGGEGEGGHGGGGE